jgi:acyl carrier protein
LCGIGELGEIVIRTPFRSLGPLPSQGPTSSFCQQNPYYPTTQEDLYFTGDLGRYRPEGTVEILGRLDEQVKIRGVRVEPNEVMHVLTTHPDVASCFVLGRKEEHGEPELVAYVVPIEGKSVQPERLREYSEARLPGPLVPTAWVFLDNLPLTANGKVDRRALPVPTRGRVQLEVPFVAPRTPTEEMLVEIWQEVLKVERIGIHDNFFDLGGHSLLATRVVSRVREEFHVEFKLMDLFKMPTIAELTKGLEGLLWVIAGKPSEDEAELQARDEGVI